MALDDFASSESMPAHAASAHSSLPEDEDLFDFPLIEMTLEAEQAPAAARTPPPSSNAARPAPAAGTKEPMAAASATANRPTADVTPIKQAADLIQGIETVLASEIDAPKSPFADQGAQRNAGGASGRAANSSSAAGARALSSLRKLRQKLAVARSSNATWIVIACLTLLNVLAFVVSWRTGRAFHAGIEGLRNELTVAAHDLRVEQQTLASAPNLSAATEAASPAARAAGHADPAPVPLEAPEKATLAVAAREIEAGEFESARRRLWRLLAIIDRIEPVQRLDIEARASVLLADSYRGEARARRGAGS